MKIQILTLFSILTLGILSSNILADHRRTTPFPSLINPATTYKAAGCTTVGCLDAGKWVTVSVCNMTYTKPVNVKLRSTDRSKWDFHFMNTNDHLNKYNNGQSHNWWHSGAPINPFDCQVGIHDHNEAFIPYASFSDSPEWENIASASGLFQPVSGWRNDHHYGGTLWLVPNIRHQIPSYDTKAPQFLFIPVASNEVIGKEGRTGESAKDYINNESCNLCSECGHCMIDWNRNQLPGFRGQMENLQTQYVVTQNNPQGLNWSTRRWPILWEGYKKTSNILNEYFNYIFLDTIKNESSINYYIAVTNAPTFEITDYLNKQPKDSKKSQLIEWLSNDSAAPTITLDNKTYYLRIYKKGFMSADNFNDQDWMTISLGTTRHMVTPAALNVSYTNHPDTATCDSLKKDFTNIANKREWSNKCWDNQTIILFPENINDKGKSAIIIGRDKQGRLIAYTYALYNEENKLTVPNHPEWLTGLSLYERDNQIFKTSPIVLEAGKNGRIMISIAHGPTPMPVENYHAKIMKADGQKADASNEWFNKADVDGCPFAQSMQILDGIYLPDMGQSDQYKTKDFTV